MEDITFGERVRAFTVEGKTGGKWEKIFQGSVIGHKFIHQFDKQEFTALRLKVNASVEEPQILSFKVYNANRE